MHILPTRCRGKYNYSLKSHVAPPGKECIQKDVNFPLAEAENTDLENTDLLDKQGEFLPTHSFFNHPRVGVPYNRSEHVKALVKAIKEGGVKLAPSTIEVLSYLLQMGNASDAEHETFALSILDAVNKSLSSAERQGLGAVLTQFTSLISNL